MQKCEAEVREVYNWCPRCLPKHTALVAAGDKPTVVFCDIHGEMPRVDIEEEFRILDAKTVSC